MNDTATKPRKSATIAQATPSEPDFVRGRDLGIGLLIEAQHLPPDAASALRSHRQHESQGLAPAQNNFVRPFLEKVAADSSLLPGFSAVLSAALGENPADHPEGYRVPIVELQAGKPGADGTGASLYDGPGEVATVASSTDADQAADAVLLHYKHALAVLELTAHEIADSGMVFAARNLMRADLPQLMAAFDQGVGALEDAGAALSVVLELIAAAAHTVDDAEESSCVWGAHALATLGMNALDAHIQEIKRSGAAS